MTVRQKGWLFMGAFLVLILIVFIVTQIIANKQDEIANKKFNEYVGKVQFKGKVINTKIFKYGGKDYFMMCVQLDYSNFKEFYVLNDYCFLKIKNNIATFSGGVLNEVPKYVEININNSRIERFHYSDGSTDDYGLSLANYGLTKDDMNVCN
jgi:hypothetical protein